MSIKYTFTKPIKLDDGSILGNTNPLYGPLGGVCFFDKEEDNEIQNKVRAQIAEDEAAKQPKEEKKSKKNT